MEETATFMDKFGILLIGIGVVVVTLIIIVAIVSARRKRVSRQEFLIRRGYTPVDPPPPELIQGLETIFLKGNVQEIQAHDIFHRLIPNGVVFLFDLKDIGDEESSWIGKDILAVKSPDLQLPRMMLQPLPELFTQGKGTGFLAKAAERAIEWGASLSGYQRVRFPNNPEFNNQFIVIANDQAEVSNFLSDIRMAQLRSLTRPYHIEANGDMFTIHEEESLQHHDGEKPGMEDKYTFLLADAQKLFNWFQ